MRQDWIEFKKNETDNLSLRPEYIIGISEFPFDMEANMDEYTQILYDVGNSVQDIAIAEPYEQVKQKIMDAEGYDLLHGMHIEPFTREEYETLLTLARCERDECEQDNIPTRVKYMNQLIDKLNEILKEDK